MSLTPCVELRETCSSCGGPAVPSGLCREVLCAACAPKKLRHAAITVKVIEHDGRIRWEHHHYLTCVLCKLTGVEQKGTPMNGDSVPLPWTT